MSQALARYCDSLETQQHLDYGLTTLSGDTVQLTWWAALRRHHFRADLSQGFDTVSRSEILSLLDELGADPSLQHLIHALHNTSKYRLHSQGDHRDVETTTGIKQGRKLAPTLFSVLTGRLLHALISIFGWDTVQKFFTGYADDFTMHRVICSQADLAAGHKLILRLLDAVNALKLKVNQAKCAMLVKLSGREAPSVLQKHTCWLPDTDGVFQRHWRLGRHKSWPAYRWEAQIEYLGIQISYGNFEKQTLRFRTAEAAKKLQQVRRFVCNGQAESVVHHGVGHTHHWLTRSRPHGGDSAFVERLVRSQTALSPQSTGPCESDTDR